MHTPFECRHWHTDPDQHVVARSEKVVFLQNASKQGALIGSRVIAPIRDAPTGFDLTEDEIRATLGLLNHVKAWMKASYQPDG